MPHLKGIDNDRHNKPVPQHVIVPPFLLSSTFRSL